MSAYRNTSLALVTDAEQSRLRLTDIFVPELSRAIRLPLFLTPVSAGDPQSAEDYVEQQLDIGRYLIKNPSTTFLVRVTGDSMIGAGIHSGDMLVVDRSIEPSDGRIVIAVIDGELTIKRLRRKGRKIMLMPENPDYEPVTFRSDADIPVWGVVTSVIHSL